MKIKVVIAVCSMIFLISCSRKVHYTTTLAQKTLNKTGATKKGKTLYKWYYSDINHDLKLTLTELDTSDFEIIRRGTIKETVTSNGDELHVLRNTVGGAFGSETLNEINVKFDKESDQTIPFEPGVDGNYYLKTTDVTQQEYVQMGGWTKQWNPYYGYYQSVWIQPYHALQNTTRYFVQIKAPDGKMKLYEANYKIALYIKHKLARKINRTSKTMSGYKPR
jgi:hypothetical protein